MSIMEADISKATCLEIAERLQERAQALQGSTPPNQYFSLIRDSDAMRKAALIIENESHKS